MSFLALVDLLAVTIIQTAGMSLSISLFLSLIINTFFFPTYFDQLLMSFPSPDGQSCCM
jgi:hypothetical protein